MNDFLRHLEPLWRPHPGQREFLDSTAKIKVLACGRRWGKTDACAVQVLRALHQPVPTKHLLIGPTQDQAQILFARILELLDRVECADPAALSNSEPASGRAKGIRGDGLKIKLSPYPSLAYRGHLVTARSGHIGRSLRGHEATHIVIDEAAFVPEDLVTEVAMPMLATTEGELTMISTPHGMNHFWQFFAMGMRGEHGIWSKQAPSRENPLVSEDFLVIQRELISERAYKVEYEAEFIELAGTVFRKEAVEACLVRELTPVEGPILIGIDWARSQDYTAVVVLQGDRQRANILEIQLFNQIGWMAQVDRVAAIIARYPGAFLAADATGVGDGILSILKEKLPPIRAEEVILSRTSKDQLLDNLNTLIEGTRLRFEPDPQLLREFEHFVREPDGKQGARSGFHDDIVMALALAARELPLHHSRVEVLGAGLKKFSRPTRRIYAMELV